MLLLALYTGAGQCFALCGSAETGKIISSLPLFLGTLAFLTMIGGVIVSPITALVGLLLAIFDWYTLKRAGVEQLRPAQSVVADACGFSIGFGVWFLSTFWPFDENSAKAAGMVGPEVVYLFPFFGGIAAAVCRRVAVAWSAPPKR
jgi:hypothetical protein